MKRTIIEIFLFSILSSILHGCNQQVYQDGESRRLFNEKHKFVITQKYIYNHSRWLEGIDSSGKINKFKYYGFFSLTELASIGDTFIKPKNCLEFYIHKRNSICKFEWNDKHGGVLIECDSSKSVKFMNDQLK